MAYDIGTARPALAKGSDGGSEDMNVIFTPSVYTKIDLSIHHVVFLGQSKMWMSSLAIMLPPAPSYPQKALLDT